MSQSTDSDSQQATPSGLDSPLQKEPPSPAMPLQLGRLTSELYKLHSSSTHNLSRVASCDLPREIRRASVDPPATKSLHDLTSFTDDSSLDGYTTPLFVSTTRGKGSFQELFLPPPIISPIKTKKKRTQQLSRRTKSPRDTERPLRTTSPQSQRKDHNSLQTLESDSKELTGEDVKVLKSSVEGRDVSGQLVGEREGSAGVGYWSKAGEKLPHRRAKFCTPGMVVCIMCVYVCACVCICVCGHVCGHITANIVFGTHFESIYM